MTVSSNPRVAVVMIFFQAERFLEEAMRSVLAQTMGDFELIAVNDGSTDGGGDIAKALAAEDGRIRLEQHRGGTNRGMSASRNRGVEVATAELIAYLDADDVWAPDHLERQLAVLEAHPEADMVCGRALYWRTWNDPDAHDDVTGIAYPAGQVIPSPDLLRAYLDDGWTTVPTCCLLVKKSLLDEVGGSEESFGSLYEDAALLAKLYLHGTATMNEEVTARYRQHADSSCHQGLANGEYRFGMPSPARWRFMAWLDSYVKQAGTTDAELLATIDRELAPYRPAWLFPARYAASRAYEKVRPRLPDGPRKLVREARGVVSGRGIGHVRFGSLRRVEPISRDFGFNRGRPIDRFYIEQFLEQHAGDIAGRCLEIGDDTYTMQFGGSKVTRADTLHVHAGNSRATFVGDLADYDCLPEAVFDAMVLTQTLHLVYDMAAAVRTIHKALKPGGVALVTSPGITPLSADEWRHNWFWSLTAASAAKLFEKDFAGGTVEVNTYGNVLAATSFLYGLSDAELKPEELAYNDPQFPMIVTVRAVRGPADARTSDSASDIPAGTADQATDL